MSWRGWQCESNVWQAEDRDDGKEEVCVKRANVVTPSAIWFGQLILFYSCWFYLFISAREWRINDEESYK